MNHLTYKPWKSGSRCVFSWGQREQTPPPADKGYKEIGIKSDKLEKKVAHFNFSTYLNLEMGKKRNNCPKNTYLKKMFYL